MMSGHPDAVEAVLHVRSLLERRYCISTHVPSKVRQACRFSRNTRGREYTLAKRGVDEIAHAP